MTKPLQQLVQMTQTLGQPPLDYVIIGEGNTSARVNDASFYVKASGQQMATIDERGFVQVAFEPILSLLDDPPETQSEQKAIMSDARLNATGDLMPSIETSFHAMLLHDCAVAFVGHTHPTAVNQLLCSEHAQTLADKRTFPDEVVLCGPRSVFVPYADPGLPLAMVMRERVRDYLQAEGTAPKVILLANHGMIALGDTPTEVLTITAMCVKAARILHGALTIGNPVFMTDADIRHIYDRPDEIYRRRLFVDDATQDETEE